MCLLNENVSKKASKSENLQNRISCQEQYFFRVPNAHLLSTLSVGSLAVQKIGKPIALPRGNYNMSVVDQLVKECSSQTVVGKNVFH